MTLFAVRCSGMANKGGSYVYDASFRAYGARRAVSEEQVGLG